jgi:hypothetical protein
MASPIPQEHESSWRADVSNVVITVRPNISIRGSLLSIPRRSNSG